MAQVVNVRLTNCVKARCAAAKTRQLKAIENSCGLAANHRRPDLLKLIRAAALLPVYRVKDSRANYDQSPGGRGLAIVQ